MFGSFGALGTRWNVVMHLLHTDHPKGGGGAASLSGLCIHETDHGGAQKIDGITNAEVPYFDGVLDDLLPLMANTTRTAGSLVCWTLSTFVARRVPMTDDAIRYFERLNFAEFGDDGTYNHNDICTGTGVRCHGCGRRQGCGGP
mmetsp:Transcript_18141/g.51918  ORF Transcript_18141/g.51918 Transcript_18141/m.51918 type:complete len:144 (-) Transcript_18141:352-783(-)